MATPYYGTDVKGYSVERIVTAQYGERYLGAGTIYLPGTTPQNAAHIVTLDNTGTPVYSTVMSNPSGNVLPVAVTQPFTGGNRSAIVCQLRYPFATGDRICIYAADINSGVGSGAVEIKSQDPTYTELYPTHAFADGDILYICGYVASGTALPGSPDAGVSEKVGMIIRYDWVNQTATSRFWNTPTSVVSQTVVRDYDMALRMRKNSNGEILVLGATNHSYTLGATTQYPSFALGMLVDAGTLADVQSPFALCENGMVTGNDPQGLYAIDVLDDGANGYWLLCNAFSGSANQFWRLGYADASFAPFAASNSMLSWNGFDYAWGNQLANDGSGNVVVFGQQTNNTPGCPVQIFASSTNVNPFLASYSLSAAASTISASTNDWKVQRSRNGTSSATPVDYLTEGGFLQDVGRLYTSMVPPDGTVNDWIVSSPVVYSQPNNVLQNKFNRLDPNREYPVCGTTYDEAPCGGGVLTNTGCTIGNLLTVTNVSIPLSVSSVGIFSYPYLLTTPLDCGGANRPASVAAVATPNPTDGLTLVPNPAAANMQVRLTSASLADGSRQVAVIDMTGRVVHTETVLVHTGQAVFSIPALAAGTYIVQLPGTSGMLRQRLTVR